MTLRDHTSLVSLEKSVPTLKRTHDTNKNPPTSKNPPKKATTQGVTSHLENHHLRTRGPPKE